MGSVVAGSAHETTTIIIGNIFTGLANAGCIMGIPAAQEVTPNKFRPWTMGFSQAFASAAVIAGTLGAGAFVKYHTWRWSYYLNAFVYGASALCVTAFYHPPPTGLRRQGHQVRELLAKIDFIGIILFTGSIASLVIALTWGGATYPWSSGRIIAPLTISCIGLVVFGIWERMGTKEGLLDHRMFYTRNFPILLFVCIIDGMLLLGVNVLFSQQIAALFTHDAVKIATVLTPFLATSAFGCLPAGWFMARTKSYRIMLVGALVWCSLFTGMTESSSTSFFRWLRCMICVGLMALIKPNRLSWAYAFSALFGIGTAVTTVIPVVALVLSVPSFLLGTAGTLSVSCRALGGIIGITIFTTIHNNKIGSSLPEHIAAVLGPAGKPELIPAVVGALMSQNPVALNMVQGLSPQLIGPIRGAQLDAETYSWKFVWIAISVLVAANAIVSCFLQPVDARMNGHIESALEESEVRKEQMEAVVTL
jgi:MFS family permease